MSDAKRPSIFQKALAAGDAWLNQQIQKGQAEIQQQARHDVEDEADFFYRKSVSKDLMYYNASQGYHEKPSRLTYDYLKMMSLKDSVISAIIQTRQNQVSGFSKLVKNPYDRGFKIRLKDEESLLEEIKEELKKTPEFSSIKEVDEDQKESSEDLDIEKSGETQNSLAASEEDALGDDLDDSPATDDDETQKINWRLERKAKEILNKRYAKRRRAVESFMLNCGKLNERPFESLRWTMDSYLRAVVRDSLTYDQLATEKVPDQAGRIHHFVPVDGSTIRYSTPDLGKFKNISLSSSYDILYPEKEVEALEKKDALDLDSEKLAQNEYKWLQVIRGRIERAFTKQELSVGMRNPTTDIFYNGYSITELELLVQLISSHLSTEYYNVAYFTQGFSAKGILHIKAPLNRRKVETIRQQWQHMIKGSRNSFQTPIFAGMDEVNWIPLTQNHSDIEFQGWLQYLIKMICAIYQIDPQEIGIGMKEEGSKGNGLSGDNTQEKIDLSRDKGLYPLLRFLENYINTNLIDELDSEFYLEFVGLKDESMQDALNRQKEEAKFKKTVNEVRAEDGLPPLPGMDDFILDATYYQWYSTFSDKAVKKAEQDQQNQMAAGLMDSPDAAPNDNKLPENAVEPHVASALENMSDANQPVEKSLRIEYYTLKE